MTIDFVSRVAQPDTFWIVEADRLTSLARFVTARREAIPLTQTALAERAGLTKSEINAIERGRVALPGADKRRRLADALGVSHLDLLVAAGELLVSEVPKPGDPRPPFPKSDRRSRILELLVDAKPHEDRIKALIEILEGWKGFDEMERQRRSSAG